MNLHMLTVRCYFFSKPHLVPCKLKGGEV
uniref:Uncharacterized protein n=1 Tax=Anguilla anguilla TaxID=7936 RepID=A0A0E9RIJ5_ANGAN